LSLLDCSRWSVAKIDDPNAVGYQLAAGNCPVVICGSDDWLRVSRTARRSIRPPSVVVLAARPNDSEWLQVLESGGHYIPLKTLNAAKLFSLLNLLWRGWHKD